MKRIGSDDVLNILNSGFVGKPESFPPVPMCEMLFGRLSSGTAVQGPLYPDTKFDHSLNFWGPTMYRLLGEESVGAKLGYGDGTILFPTLKTSVGSKETQTKLHWMSHTRAGDTTDVLRVFHHDRETDKSVNISLYSLLAFYDENDPAKIAEVQPGGELLFPFQKKLPELTKLQAQKEPLKFWPKRSCLYVTAAPCGSSTSTNIRP